MDLVSAESPTGSIRVTFAALMRIVEMAGVGAQTTHGFGAVDLLELT